MKKTEFVYDEHSDCYLCPGGQELPYRTTTKEGYRQYLSNSLHCKKCPLHVWDEHLEEADHLRHMEKRTKSSTQDAKNQLNGSLPMQRKSMECGGQPLGEMKNCPCRRCLLLLL